MSSVSGAMLIFGSIVSHGCIGGALFREVSRETDPTKEIVFTIPPMKGSFNKCHEKLPIQLFRGEVRHYQAVPKDTQEDTRLLQTEYNSASESTERGDCCETVDETSAKKTNWGGFVSHVSLLADVQFMLFGLLMASFNATMSVYMSFLPGEYSTVITYCCPYYVFTGALYK